MRTILILCLLIGFIGCKKETKKPSNSEASGPFVEDPDFEITAKDFNFPIGKTWVYSIVSNESMGNFDNPTDPFSNYSHTTTDSYTVTVTRDSIDGASNYRFYTYRLSNGQSGEVQTTYTDTINLNYHMILDGTIGFTTFGPNALSIKLPLQATSTWNNLYYPSLSDINECEALGFETLYYPEYLKCIKWQRKYYMGDDKTNVYWFSKKHGLIKHVGYSYYSTNNGNLITVTNTTISLQSVN